MKRIAIVQSAYIPWKGFFDMISRCDIFVIYDTSVFSKGHWFNRNRIKRERGNRWLTIPVRSAGQLGQKLQDVKVARGWAERHWSILTEAYKRAPFYEMEAPAIRAVYEAVDSEPLLTNINENFLRFLSQRLGLTTTIVRDRQFRFSGSRTERLMEICDALGATHYLSGPSARGYLEIEMFQSSGVTLEWMTYGPYPQYVQPHGPFINAVSTLDTLFCCGPDAISKVCPTMANRR